MYLVFHVFASHFHSPAMKSKEEHERNIEILKSVLFPKLHRFASKQTWLPVDTVRSRKINGAAITSLKMLICCEME
jgi:hypothetical protein